MKTIVLTPAYGRDYSSAVDAETDFLENRDFILWNPVDPWNGKPANLRDLRNYSDYTHAQIRFNFNRGLTVVFIQDE